MAWLKKKNKKKKKTKKKQKTKNKNKNKTVSFAHQLAKPSLLQIEALPLFIQLVEIQIFFFSFYNQLYLNFTSHILLLKNTFNLFSFFFFFFSSFYNLWSQKVLEASAHSISSPRPTPRRKKCPRTNEGNPNYQNVLLRTTLSSAGQNYGRKKRHIARGHPLEDHKRDSKPYGLAIGEQVGRQPQEKLSPLY